MTNIKKILKSRNNRIMTLILIIGTVIILFSGIKPKSENTNIMGSENIKREEERLSEILSQIDGAGNVSVMISYESTMEKDIAYDGTNERAITSGGDVLVRKELYPKVKGVIVIADGAANPGIKQSIKEAVTAVTGAGANRVCVYESGGK